MANKTVVVVEPGLATGNTTGLILKLYAEGSTTVANGSGDTLTYASRGRFSCTVTEALSGIYDCVIFDTDSTTILTGLDRSMKIYIPGDIAGTYTAGSEVELARAAFVNQVYPVVQRSVADTNSIRVFLDIGFGQSVSGTVSINNGTAANIAGTISYIGAIGSKYEYNIAYNAADRPTSEGTARYALTDGTNTRYVTLQTVTGLTAAQAAKLDLIGTGSATVTAPVTADGFIRQIIRGDDYLASNGRAFEFSWTAATGYVAGTSTCKFGGISACDGTTVGWSITGTIANNAGIWTLSFDMTKTVSAALADDKYDWSVEVTNAAGLETTTHKSITGRPAIVLDKQT